MKKLFGKLISIDVNGDSIRFFDKFIVFFGKVF